MLRATSAKPPAGYAGKAGLADGFVQRAEPYPRTCGRGVPLELYRADETGGGCVKVPALLPGVPGNQHSLSGGWKPLQFLSAEIIFEIAQNAETILIAGDHYAYPFLLVGGRDSSYQRNR